MNQRAGEVISLNQFKLCDRVASNHDHLARFNLDRFLNNGAQLILAPVIYLDQERMGAWGDLNFLQNKGGPIMAHSLRLVDLIEQSPIIHLNHQAQGEAAGALNLFQLEMRRQFSRLKRTT